VELNEDNPTMLLVLKSGELLQRGAYRKKKSPHKLFGYKLHAY
jgi:hypothetical protein